MVARWTVTIPPGRPSQTSGLPLGSATAGLDPLLGDKLGRCSWVTV